LPGLDRGPGGNSGKGGRNLREKKKGPKSIICIIRMMKLGNKCKNREQEARAWEERNGRCTGGGSRGGGKQDSQGGMKREK